MKSSKKGIIIALVVGLGLFGYSQYAFASQIEVMVTESELLEENGMTSVYLVQLEFDNPSLLVLTAGETEFQVTADNQKIGEGKLEPFMLGALSKTMVDGRFVSNTEINSDNTPSVEISGVTKYDVLFTSIDVPFVYYPTQEQASEFIHQN